MLRFVAFCRIDIILCCVLCCVLLRFMLRNAAFLNADCAKRRIQKANAAPCNRWLFTQHFLLRFAHFTLRFLLRFLLR